MSSTPTVALLRVSLFGTVNADVIDTSPTPPGRLTAASVRSHDSLERFLSEGRYHVPTGTPVIRFDRAGEDFVTEFVTRGPMCHPVLAAGTVSRFEAGLQPWYGEHWSEMGMLTNVAPDVYVELAAQAGIPVEHSAS